jgi:hypothetical protein
LLWRSTIPVRSWWPQNYRESVPTELRAFVSCHGNCGHLWHDLEYVDCHISKTRSSLDWSPNKFTADGWPDGTSNYLAPAPTTPCCRGRRVHDRCCAAQARDGISETERTPMGMPNHLHSLFGAYGAFAPASLSSKTCPHQSRLPPVAEATPPPPHHL